MTRPKTAIARRGLIACCPGCSEPNIICLAAAELNPVEMQSIEDLLSREEMSQLFVAPDVICCKVCGSEFEIEVSQEYYYEESN